MFVRLLYDAGFTNYLFMDAHSVFNRVHRTVYQDMRRPLSHYFIATSHNTYVHVYFNLFYFQ